MDEVYEEGMEAAEPRQGGLPTEPFQQRLGLIQAELREVHRIRRSARRRRALRRRVRPAQHLLATIGTIALAAGMALVALLAAW